jgi:hypothetical protein
VSTKSSAGFPPIKSTSVRRLTFPPKPSLPATEIGYHLSVDS